MAMSDRIRRELGKSRELLWLLLYGKKCFFCKKPIMSASDLSRYGDIRFGNATAPPMDMDITEHHKDGDHENNDPSNLALCHESCHKSHHAKLVFRAWRKGEVGTNGRYGCAA